MKKKIRAEEVQDKELLRVEQGVLDHEEEVIDPLDAVTTGG